MPRTKRHVTSNVSTNPNEDSGHSDAPCATSLVPPITTEEHKDVAVQPEQIETTDPSLVRGNKRSARAWDVQIKVDGNGEMKRRKLRAIDIFTLPPGERVIVEWNNQNQPVDLSREMLAQFLGHIAGNCQNFPIRYEKWKKIPQSYKDHVWNNIIKTKMEVNNDEHKDYIFKSLAKKWQDHRYNPYSYTQCDPDASLESNIAKKPTEIPLEQRQNHEELVIQSQNSFENGAFINVLGKEHSGYVRGLGLGAVPTQVYGASSSSSGRYSASGGTPSELEALRETVRQLTQQVELHQHQIAFLTQQLANQGQNAAPNMKNTGSASIGRRSSQDSHSAHGEHSSDPDA
ncbi:hypothetical protein IHE45_11G059200 [Dioscorea alata]|uniref:Uncharacterized protein n=1 Tax=Dioscorea alata TaxID=55571 RepID=A0ACB7V6X7_DIOAL|nr:hypothetical protein IHE45_11G059200 [Dioscorea alata]